MKIYKPNVRRILLIIICFLFYSAISQNLPDIVYTSPKDGSLYNSPSCKVIIRFKEVIEQQQFENTRLTILSNDIDTVSGAYNIIDNGLAVIFTPYNGLLNDKVYSALLTCNNENGETKSLHQFSFRITKKIIEGYRQQKPTHLIPSNNGDRLKANRFRNENNLPDDFPAIIMTHKDNPNPGNYFISARQGGNTYPGHNYTIILDTCGIPIFFHKLNNRGSDFRLQPNGYLTHYPGDLSYYVQYDSSYNQNNEYTAATGFTTDMHELVIKEDSSYWLLSKQLHLIDMSTIVPGGNPNATVEENLIQHLDRWGNLLWQWNSLDHIPITDCDQNFVDLTSFYIDYIHINAIDFDYDGNILISSRHLNEITKINISNGDIIWRMGGIANEFTFINDPDGFYGQHSIRYHGDSVYTLFDNGNWHNPPRSRGVEYIIDQQAKTAVLMKEFVPGDSPLFAPEMGHLQKTDDRSVILGWAANIAGLVLTDFDELGNKRIEFHNYDTACISYRAYKFPWKTNAFYFNSDTLVIVSQTFDTSYNTIELYNNSNADLLLSGFQTCSDVFFVHDAFPITVPPFGNHQLIVGLSSVNQGYFTDVLTIYSQTQSDSVRIAAQTRLIGDVTVGIEEFPSESSLIIKVHSNIIEVSATNNEIINYVDVYDMTGRLLFNMKNISLAEVSIPVNMQYNVIVSVRTKSGKVFNRKVILPYN